MTSDSDDDLREVERLLSRLREDAPEVPSGLAERVLAEGRRLQPVPRRSPARDRPVSRGRFRDFLGGWGAFGGLAAASCAGFWIGVSPPEGGFDPATLFAVQAPEAYDDAAELSGFGWDMQER